LQNSLLTFASTLPSLSYIIFNICSKLATTSAVRLGIMPNCIMWIRFSGYCATNRMYSKEDDLDEIGLQR